MDDDLGRSDEQFRLNGWLHKRVRVSAMTAWFIYLSKLIINLMLNLNIIYKVYYLPVYYYLFNYFYGLIYSEKILKIFFRYFLL